MGPNPPIVLDLANLPSGWSVSIVSGCNPVTDGTCQPSDRYDSGITGTLSISGNIGAPQMSACASVDEGTTPHPVMHSVHAWTPPVSPP
jgi:hypothetical protein